ncbi:MAG: FAD-linked oxidase C-terminal domain-containing protein, partial [Venatoribacter sp.]
WQKEKVSTSKIIVENGGTISHQHGVGKDHAPYLPTEKGELGMKAVAAVMTEFDPETRLNPGTLL